MAGFQTNKGGKPMTSHELQKNPIEKARDKFEQWRQSKKKRSRIPEDLWMTAIELSEKYSVNQISKALRLNSSSLKKRIEQSKSDCLPEPVESSMPSFLEIGISQPETAQYIIELTHRNGSKMKAQIKNSNLDIIEMSKIFLGNS